MHLILQLRSFYKILKLSQPQAELHLLKVDKLDVCIIPLFTNPVTYVVDPADDGMHTIVFLQLITCASTAVYAATSEHV